MSTELQKAAIPSDIAHLDGIAQRSMLTRDHNAGNFSAALVMAEALEQMNNALTDEIMDKFMPLMNNPLGFLTDRDPNMPDKNGNRPSPYPKVIVKRCVIEAVLRGVNVAGNEFNIISARPYITKAGVARQVRQFPGLTDLRLNFGVPVMKQQGAIVPASATWKLNGVDQEYAHREFPVRVNRAMGIDAIIGKATRKLLAAVYEQLTGSEYALPEGEVGDHEYDESGRRPVESTTSAGDAALENIANQNQTQTPKASVMTEGEKAFIEMSEMLASENDVDVKVAKDRLRGFAQRVYSTAPETLNEKQIADLWKHVNGGSINLEAKMD